jgi:hypothetical protein
MRSTLRIAVLASVLAALHAAYCQSGTTSPSVSTRDDYAKAEDDYGSWGMVKHHDLHAYPFLSNGAKGYTAPLDEIYGLRIGHSSSDLMPFQNEDDFSFHSLVCRCTAIVVGTLVGSESHLSKNRNTIFTRYHFKVDLVIKEGPGVAVGGNVDVINLGGSVVDEGELLTVMITGTAPYEVNERYVLFLIHDPRASLNVFDNPQLIKLRVKDGNIEAHGPEYVANVANGESIDSFRQRVAASLAKAACR